MIKRLLVLGLLLQALTASQAFAYRREYAITWEGQRKPGSEVCFYRGVRGDAFALFFSPSAVSCLSADAILDFPPGLIHVFARHKDGFASAQRDFTIYDGPPNPERGYEKLETPLLRAGTVDFSSVIKTLGSNQRVGIWIASGPQSLGTFIPLVPGETTTLAPAGMTVVPILLQGGDPVSIGEPLDLEPGERQTPRFQMQPQTGDVIAWAKLDEIANRNARITQSPEIFLKVGDRIFRPVAPIYHPASNTFVIFRGVPAGKARLVVQGSGWTGMEREINVPVQSLLIEREAIPLIAGGSLIIRWTTEGAVRSPAECPTARTPDVPVVRAGLLKCSADSAEKKCSTVARMTAPYLENASLKFAGVASGSYTLMIEPPWGKRQSLAVDVSAGEEHVADVTFPSFKFFGTVKVNGKPMHARLIFDSGQAVSDDDGRYTALLSGDPRASQIQIEPCAQERTLRFIPRSGPAANSAFDLDVRLHVLDVKVTDSRHQPVANASVRFSPIKEILPSGRSIYFGSKEKQTDKKGLVSFDDVPEGFLLSVCARHKEFAQKCGEPVDLVKLSDNPVPVEFDPVATHGRVEGHTGWGMVAAVGLARTMTERAELDDTGKFLFTRPHAAPEYLIYISQNRPLTVLPLPSAPSPELLVQVPAVPVRSFTVTVPDNRSDFSFLGVWIGDMYVPVDVFNTHMEMRGLDSIIHGATPLRVPDIAETAPISVAFGVLPPGDNKGFVDPFTLPQYAGVERHRVSGATVMLSP